jgi:hypothetical protein
LLGFGDYRYQSVDFWSTSGSSHLRLDGEKTVSVDHEIATAVSLPYRFARMEHHAPTPNTLRCRMCRTATSPNTLEDGQVGISNSSEIIALPVLVFCVATAGEWPGTPRNF